MALAVVLALAGGATLALHSVVSSSTAHVSASTQPDKASVSVVHGNWGTVYQHTFTKPADVHTLYGVLNGPRSTYAVTPTQIPFCDLDAGYSAPPFGDPRYL